MKALDLFTSNRKGDILSGERNDDAPASGPLKSWDLFSEYHQQKMLELKKYTDLSLLASFSKKYNWENNLSDIILKNKYEALVLTNMKREILWVNEGFTNMSGYTKKYAISKTPAFLQGTATSPKVREEIREKLSLDNPFKVTLTNYKSNHQAYDCELHIFPLKNGDVTHYLALENQA